MKTNKTTTWMAMFALFFLGACAATEQSTTSTGVSGDRFTSYYNPYVKHTEFFTILKGDYDRLVQRRKNYWDYYKSGYSFQGQNRIYLGEFVSTAPEQIGSVKKGYAEDFKETLAVHFRGMGYTIEDDAGDFQAAVGVGLVEIEVESRETMLPVDDQGEVTTQDAAEQLQQVLRQLDAVLRHADSGKDQLVRLVGTRWEMCYE